MATLYVIEPGARIEKEHLRLLVTLHDEVIGAMPLAHVTEVVLVGGVGATTPAMLALLDQGAGLTLISSTGQLRGRLRPAEARNVPLRQAQYRRAADEAFALALSRRIVAGKLRNSRTLARRMARSRPLAAVEPTSADAAPPAADQASPAPEPPSLTPAFEQLNTLIAQAPLAHDLAELRGLEGRGAKAYFAVLRATLHADLTFVKRSRRPPGDAANALLSLAYSLLTNAVFTAAEVVGLDPYAGFLHADKYGRPALALDLVEEFRSIVADSVVLWVVNKRMLVADDFEQAEAGGWRLARNGLRVFLQQFTRRLQTEVFHPEAGRPLSYQKILEVQARQVRRCIERGEADYQPFLAK